MPERIPTPAQIKRWRQYLADERAEAAVYRDLAKRREGDEYAILMALAEAERRHEQHWLDFLGEHAETTVRPSMRNQAFFRRRAVWPWRACTARSCPSTQRR